MLACGEMWNACLFCPRGSCMCIPCVLRDALLTRRAAWAVASSVSASLLSVVVDEPVRQREVNFALEGGVLVEWA